MNNTEEYNDSLIKVIKFIDEELVKVKFEILTLESKYKFLKNNKDILANSASLIDLDQMGELEDFKYVVTK